MKILVGLVVTIVLSLSLWAFIYKTFPMFAATETIAASNAAGVLTPEQEAVIRAEDVKSSLVVFTAWGVVLGLIGALAGGAGSPPLIVRLLIGCVLGALVGAGTNYLSNWYALRSEPPLDPIQYWTIRTSLIHIPFALVVATMATFGSSWSKLPENAIKSVVAIILIACLYSFLMGSVTPIEQPRFIYPGFPQNSFALLMSVNVLLFLAVSVRTNRGGAQGVEAKKTAEPTPATA